MGETIIELEDKIDDSKRYCLGCLCDTSVRQIYSYNLICRHVKEIFKMQSILLCYLCKRIAQNVEHFIQKVQNNQILLENFNNVKYEIDNSVRSQIQPLVKQEEMTILVMDTSEGDGDIAGETSSVLFSSNLDVKIEIKEETDSLDNSKEVDNDDEIPDIFLKDEDEFPLVDLLKERLVFENSGENNDDLNLSTLQENIQKKDKIKKVINGKKLRKDIPKIKLIYLTKRQCLEERSIMAQDQNYLNCIYKCKNCIKGFICKGTYDIHMEKHNKSIGDYECDLCKQRMDTKEKLVYHMKRHKIRYKCMECGLTRNCKPVIQDHYSTHHLGDSPQHFCSICMKTFTRSSYVRKHKLRVHSLKERVQCAYCNRTYRNKTSLKSHIILKHTKEISHGEVKKKCICSVCGMAFRTPSQLKNHTLKHSDTRNFYCVECDKSFKSAYVLKTHLKTASIHVDNKELPFPCEHCDKRFSNRRDLTNHINGVHLNVKPFACNKCDKAYICAWALKEHKRNIHEGYKKPLRYPCSVCDKVFHSNYILKNHIRIHTGERPYQCSKCPATFNQASILRTHDRLIHLKLTRTGRCKTKK